MEHQEFNRNPWGKSQIWHSHHYIPAFIWHLTLQNPLFPSSRNVFKMVIKKNTMSTDLTFPVSTVIEGVQKAIAPHSSTLAWKIPWTGELVGCSSWGRWGSDTTERLHFHFLLSCIEEGNGNPLQCSCLEDPRDGGAWRPAVYGVAQSWTRLKRLSSSLLYARKSDPSNFFIYYY